jgi:predicted methyltransferase
MKLTSTSLVVLSCLAATACSIRTPPRPVDAPDPVLVAVAAPERPAEDRARDADRKPTEVLHFFAIEPGMQVAELMTGRGYYAEILARAVGPTGRVYAHNSPFVLKRFAEAPLAERLARPGLENVSRLDREVDDPGLPAGELDAVLLILFYHDTYWMEADRARMNRAVFESLVPGGVYGVIDHFAEDGSGARDVKTLHRVDAQLVKKEILAAGFELEAESELLRHPEDDRTKNVFDEDIRGKTDRFIYRFRKPG